MSVEASFLQISFFALIVLFILTLIVYLFYSGIVSDIEVLTKEPDIGDDGLIIAYKTGKGPYKGCGLLFTEAYCLLPHRETIGIYYDDPESVAPQDLRYAVGIVLSSKGDVDLKEDEMHKMLINGFKIAHFPKPAYAVMASFPFRTTLSIYLAIYRVYPKLKNYIASRGLCAYPAIEIYSKEKIKFMMPLSRQDEFYVLEFSEEEVSIATTEVSSFTDSSHNYQKDVINDSETPKRDEAIFVKPKTPKPVSESKKSTTPKKSEIEEEEEEEDDEEEEEEEELERSESTSSFEDIGSTEAVMSTLKEDKAKAHI